MLKLIFATNNSHKLEEIKHAISNKYLIMGLKEVNIFEEMPETHDTLEENAIEKAMYIYEKHGYNCFADDSGLEIEALKGRPGVFSARYAGIGCTFEDNINKVLKEMASQQNRKAIFRTVIALIENGKVTTFEGSISGEITMDKRGSKGFGYDPLFIPDGFKETFAEMPLKTKNSISHRARAVEKFLDYLKSK